MDHRAYYFWQSSLSPHQSGHIRALAELGNEVYWLVDTRLNEVRREMGWREPDTGNVNVLCNLGWQAIDRVVQQSEPTAIHFLGGLRGCRSTWPVALACMRYRRNFAAILEAGDHRGFSGSIRQYLLHPVLTLPLRTTSAFVLAFGELGVNWYARVGLPRSRLHEFAYSVDENDLVPVPVTVNDTFQLAFVGSLISLKNVSLLLKALGRVPGNWQLKIIGNGVEESTLRNLAAALGLSNKITWLHAQAHANALRHMAAADLLVLPSDYDGWGAVAGEGLAFGTRVICSSACGSSSAVASAPQGNVFVQGAEEELSRCIRESVEKGPVTVVERATSARWGECLHGRNVARYLVAVVERNWNKNFPAPVPPWRCSRNQ